MSTSTIKFTLALLTIVAALSTGWFLVFSYSYLIWFVFGFLVPLVVLAIFEALHRSPRLVLSCLFSVLVLVFLLFGHRVPRLDSDKAIIGTVEKYEAVIRPSDPNDCTEFEIKESVQIKQVIEPGFPDLPEEDAKQEPAPKKGAQANPKNIAQPLTINRSFARKIQVRSEGWFVWQAEFKPLDVSIPEYKNEIIFGKKGGLGHVAFEWVDGRIRVVDMLPGAFLHADGAKAEPIPFGKDKETINWQLQSLQPDRDIAFNFFKPTFRRIHKLIPSPFRFVRSAADILPALWGCLLSSLSVIFLTLLIRPLGKRLASYAGDLVSSWWKRKNAPPPVT